MTNHAKNGAARERKVRDHMTAAGWRLVMRSAGSKGCADLCMVHPTHGLALVQVGTEKSKTLSPADRTRFLEMADLCGALAILAVTSRAGITYWRVGAGTAGTWELWGPHA